MKFKLVLAALGLLAAFNASAGVDCATLKDATCITPIASPPPPPPPPCIPTSATRSLTCPLGQVGSWQQKQDYTCPAASWTAWYDTVNTCAVPPPPPPSCTPTSQTRALTCPVGYVGSWSQQSDFVCPGGTWTPWYDVTNTCTALPPPPCVPTSSTQSLACPLGMTGIWKQQRDFQCPAATWTAWYDTTKTCAPPPPPPSFCTAGQTLYQKSMYSKGGESLILQAVCGTANRFYVIMGWTKGPLASFNSATNSLNRGGFESHTSIVALTKGSSASGSLSVGYDAVTGAAPLAASDLSVPYYYDGNNTIGFDPALLSHAVTNAVGDNYTADSVYNGYKVESAYLTGPIAVAGYLQNAVGVPCGSGLTVYNNCQSANTWTDGSGHCFTSAAMCASPAVTYSNGETYGALSNPGRYNFKLF